MKRMLVHFRGHVRDSILAPLLKMLEALFDLFVPLVTAAIIDIGIANRDGGYILGRGGLLAALGFIGLAISITAQFFAARASVGFAASVRHGLFSKILSFGEAESGRFGAGTLIARMTSDVNQVQNGLNLFLRLFMRSPFIVFGSMAMAFVVDARIAWVFVIAIPLVSVVVFGIMLWTMPMFKSVQGALDKVLGILRGNLTGVRVIRAFGREEEQIGRFEAANETLNRLQVRTGHITAWMNPLSFALVNLAVVAILWSGALRVEAGTLRQGQVIALVSYMGQILVELVKLANLIIQIAKALACAGRIQNVLDVEPEMRFPELADTMESTDATDVTDVTDAADAADTTDMADAAVSADSAATAADRRQPAVRFRNVSFTWPGAGDPSLADLSFEAMPGRTVGIIGGTGSGKSTLIGLLARLHDATEGEVSLFGRDIRQWTKENLARTVAVVPQKAQLFKGTIRSNLLAGNPFATDEQLWRALEDAQAAEFVRKEADGLDAPVAQGGRNLSGGQRQRLTIARALAGNPHVLLLDDSASALDQATDAALRKALHRRAGETTVFIAAQRTSSLRHADLILVLEDGALVGAGDHEALMRDCAVYREIHESQFGTKGGAA